LLIFPKKIEGGENEVVRHPGEKALEPSGARILPGEKREPFPAFIEGKKKRAQLEKGRGGKGAVAKRDIKNIKERLCHRRAPFPFVEKNKLQESGGESLVL